MEQVNNEKITEITNELDVRCNPRNDPNEQPDTSEYKWKLLGDNQNEPTQVHFYKEDMKDKVSISLSNIFDMWLRHYEEHLDNKRDMERGNEIRLRKNELLKSYRLFVIQSVKDEIIKREIKLNKTNIKDLLRGRKYNNNFVNTTFSKWRMENGESIREIYGGYLEHRPFFSIIQDLRTLHLDSFFTTDNQQNNK